MRKKKSPMDRGVNHERTLVGKGFGTCRCAAGKAAWAAADHLSPQCPEIGSPVEGCTCINPEAAFAATWEEESERQRSAGVGALDLLQQLMITSRDAKPGELSVPDPGNFLRRLYVALRITMRDRTVAATVIQWLGTNGGWSFLTKALKRCGYAVVSQAELDELHRDRRRLHEIEKDKGSQAV